MLYDFLKAAIRLALPLWARRLEVLNAQAMKTEGPLLLASNHPNSFLDAVLVGTSFGRPVHFITRGDVFKTGWIRRTMESLNMIPIFRIRDGKDKLSQNEETFIKSVDVLRKGGVLLIFVEGFCENQKSLQLPLKKGAARILQSCWQEGIPVQVLPVWLEYSSYNRYAKTIRMSFGKLFGQADSGDITSANGINTINAEMTKQLLHLSQHPPFVHQSPGALQHMLLFIPAMFSAVVHAPLYLPLNAAIKEVNKKNVHYDAMLLGGLLFLYPVYLLLIAGILFALLGLWWVWPLVLLGMPALAWCYVHWKK